MQTRSFFRNKANSKPLTPRLFGVVYGQEEMALLASMETLKTQLTPAKAAIAEDDLVQQNLDKAYYESIKAIPFQNLTQLQRMELTMDPAEVSKKNAPLPLAIKNGIDWLGYDKQQDVLDAFWQLYNDTRYQVASHYRSSIEKKVITFWENKRRKLGGLHQQPFRQNFSKVRVADLAAGGCELLKLWEQFVAHFSMTRERAKAPGGFKEVCAQFLYEHGDNEYNRRMVQILAAPLRNRLYQQGHRGRYNAQTPILVSKPLLAQPDPLLPTEEEVRAFKNCHGIIQGVSYRSLFRTFEGEHEWLHPQEAPVIATLKLKDRNGHIRSYPCFATSSKFESAIGELLPRELEVEQDYGTSLQQVIDDQKRLQWQLESAVEYAHDPRVLSPGALWSKLYEKLRVLENQRMVEINQACALARLEASLIVNTPLPANIPLPGKKNPVGVKAHPALLEEDKKEEEKSSKSPNKRNKPDSATQETFEQLKKGSSNNKRTRF